MPAEVFAVLVAFVSGVLFGYALRAIGTVPREAAEADPEAVHRAMQDAPHDGQPFRQARAAIARITKGIP